MDARTDTKAVGQTELDIDAIDRMSVEELCAYLTEQRKCAADSLAVQTDRARRVQVWSEKVGVERRKKCLEKDVADREAYA